MTMSAVENETLPPAQAEVLGGVIVYLIVQGASKVADFYQRAFGATEAFRYPEDKSGRTMHIHLHINGSSVMLSYAYPEHGCAWEKPQGFNIALQVDNIDTWFERAVAAGAEVVLPITQMFWGSRYAQLRDPFGIMWAINEKPRA
jgi:uncharacterized glyoxalase superfamily protein PhnB